jgi:succinate dehydrogenase/fumarate reductase flavoprotein subunit
MASGVWAGRGAADFAARLGRLHLARRTQPLGGAALRPTSARKPEADVAELVATVRQEMLPLDRNFFRTGPRLEASLQQLHVAWRDLRTDLLASRQDVAKAREAAAMIATARWILASALERRESRGINRRLDFPALDPAQEHHLTTGGLDHVWVRPGTPVRKAAAS